MILQEILNFFVPPYNLMTRKLKRHIILATLKNKNKIQLAKFSHPKKKKKPRWV
jgi:hypothetical protein